ncbi:transcription antitermination factor NusB [Peribacillus tepidiphilus]|jgi:transcription antitermination protein NusB|uniref:transcription antitermination factor NusB n=1 Tax=Peribacillus tepidiphilus TaxID=2652445 RepID=UPI001290A8FD|nr:transcription antitermination factor NusB [Peribacillus tepidiphilus]
MKRREAREKALQALFQIDLANADVNEAIESVLEDRKSDEYFEFLVRGTADKKQEIDEIIKKNLEKWRLERLANVDRNILRLAVFEMLDSEETPVKVVIDEAIEIAKLYGDESSGKFVNAVLSKVKTYLNK